MVSIYLYVFAISGRHSGYTRPGLGLVLRFNLMLAMCIALVFSIFTVVSGCTLNFCNFITVNQSSPIRLHPVLAGNTARLFCYVTLDSILMNHY